MKRTVFILIILILSSLTAKSQWARVNGLAYVNKPDTTSIFSGKHTWNFSRIVGMMKWIEDNRHRFEDSVYVLELDTKFRELKTYCKNGVNYALLDKQINQISSEMEKIWYDSYERSTPDGLIRKEILSRKPNETDQLILDGMQLRKENKLDKAYENYHKALEKDPSQLNYYYLVAMEEMEFKQDTTKALDYINKVIELSKGKDISTFQPYLIRAWINGTRNQYNLVCDDCNRVLVKDSTNEIALYYRGYTKELLKDFGSAVADAQRLLKNLRLKPYSVTTDSANLLNKIGWFYYKLKEYKLCVQYANKSLLLRPNNAYTLDTRGSGHFGLGEYEKCIDDMTKVIRLDPELSNSWYLRGLSYLKMNNQDQACADLAVAEDFGVVEASEAMKGLCLSPVKTGVENQRQFPKKEPKNIHSGFGIDYNGMIYFRFK